MEEACNKIFKEDFCDNIQQRGVFNIMIFDIAGFKQKN